MKETREETYRKVFIKTEADFPKENGHFYTDELTDQRWSLDELYQFWIKEVKHG